MASTPDGQDSPPSLLQKIDLVADRFEREWRQGNRPRILDHLGATADDPRVLLPLLVELVGIDLEHRARRNLPVTLAEYFREFPELASLPAADRADLESHARRCDELARTVDHVPAAAASAQAFPPTIGRFPVAGRLGSGTQADVFLSFHPDLQIPVVLKWHRAAAASGSEAEAAHRERLLVEGRILAGLKPHDNLVRVYDLGFHDGRPYLVLEHVQGRTLDQHAEGERIDPRRAAELVAALAEAMQAAHERGVVHQDINPRNVLVDDRGQPRLIDFGLAWFRPPWRDGTSGADARPDAGTPRYLAPEQADPRAGPVGPRTDVFGLGAVLYFLLAGRPLHDGSTLHEVLHQAAGGSVDTAVLDARRIPKRLAAACRKALARDPQARFATAAELAGALRRAARPHALRRLAPAASLFLAAAAGGWLLAQSSGRGPGIGPAAGPGAPALAVRVWRPGTGYAPLNTALPVRTGDELQVRVLAPAGLHLGLCAIDGRGKLSLLQDYPPQPGPAEIVYPGTDKTVSLEPPIGTEAFVVYGRSDRALTAAELQAAWGNAAAWPALEPPGRLLRLLPEQLREEGERVRGVGAVHDRPGSDTITGRFEALRQQLRRSCAFFEGLAFAHE
jgi:tRNA A-37 threonylcarbamoyl transferase component Bud32